MLIQKPFQSFVSVVVAVAASCAQAALTLDPSFGSGGIATLPYKPVNAQTARATDLALYPDGKYAVAGRYVTNVFFAGVETTGFITRLDAHGNVDSALFGGSITRQPTPSLLVQPDGQLLSGSANLDGPLARYRYDGTLDKPFTDRAAAALVSIHPDFQFVDFTRQGDGKIVVLGKHISQTWPRPTLIRLNADGTLDNTFENGRDLVNASILDVYGISNVAQAPDGHLYVVVNAVRALANGPLLGVTVIRTRPNGELDPTFGFAHDGIVEIPIAAAFASESAQYIATDSKGCLIVPAYRAGENLQQLSVRRIDNFGAVDTTFGVGGEFTHDFDSGPIFSAIIAALAVQSDDRILFAIGTGREPMSLWQLTNDGRSDSTFGVNGVLPTPLNWVEDIAVTADGAMVLAGTQRVADEMRAVVARFVGGSVPAVEFYNPARDHYFITANPLEVHDLDFQVHPGWSRTGYDFRVMAESAGNTGGLRPVCRFYIPPSKGDSHFFSASQTECATIRELTISDPNYDGYIEETPNAFFVEAPGQSTVTCSSTTTPVYRLWNGRRDSNHRYTTSRAVQAQMISLGYIPEGYGPDGVAMCASGQ